jgi:hypothetical protein
VHPAQRLDVRVAADLARRERVGRELLPPRDGVRDPQERLAVPDERRAHRAL